MPSNPAYNAKARGTAAERLVEADLLLKGLEVSKPAVDYGDDYHTRFSVGWRSIQVKVRDPRSKQKAWRPHSGDRVTSSILALVDPHTREVRYSSNDARRLPKELR
jgi:hypothetical protein